MRYLYEKTRDQYFSQFVITESSHYLVFENFINKILGYKERAFDFNNGTYWTPISSSEENVHLTICFNSISFKIEKFQLTTSWLGCLPGTFDISVSNDGNNFFGNRQYEANMKPNETLVFDYNSDYVKCVRHRPITKINSCNRLAHDITQLEFFGYFKNESEIHDLSYDDLIFM